MTTRPYYGEMVKRILDTRRNAPLSPAALEVLAVIAYNQPVSRSFIEQVRGVDSSSTVSQAVGKRTDRGSRAVWTCPASRSRSRSPTHFCVCSAWARLADLPPLHGEAGTTNARKLNLILTSIPPRTANSWNGSDCL